MRNLLDVLRPKGSTKHFTLVTSLIRARRT